jgi:hypothetical protein
MVRCVVFRVLGIVKRIIASFFAFKVRVCCESIPESESVELETVVREHTPCHPKGCRRGLERFEQGSSETEQIKTAFSYASVVLLRCWGPSLSWSITSAYSKGKPS